MSVRTPDPRGVRVSVVGAGPGAPEAILVEPAPIPIVAAPRATGVGLLGGVIQRPAAPPATLHDGSATIDGVPLQATLRAVGAERWVLAEAPSGPIHQVLMRPAGSSSDIPAPGVTRHEVVIDGWRIEVDVQSATRAALEERARRGRDEAGRSGPTEVHA
ncbi:MAG: hypothetical protein ACREBE_23060, partial [bacterium]